MNKNEMLWNYPLTLKSLNKQLNNFEWQIFNYLNQELKQSFFKIIKSEENLPKEAWAKHFLESQLVINFNYKDFLKRFSYYENSAQLRHQIKTSFLKIFQLKYLYKLNNHTKGMVHLFDQYLMNERSLDLSLFVNFQFLKHFFIDGNQFNEEILKTRIRYNCKYTRHLEKLLRKHIDNSNAINLFLNINDFISLLNLPESIKSNFYKIRLRVLVPIFNDLQMGNLKDLNWAEIKEPGSKKISALHFSGLINEISL